MKKFYLLLSVFSLFFISSSFAFRDISPNSPWFPAIDNLVQKDLLSDGTFFKPQIPVTHEFFWPIVLKDSGFSAESATFNTKLPPNVNPDDPLAQYIREGIRRGFIDATIDFKKYAPITRIEALRVLIRTKALPVVQGNSKAFLRRLGGVPAQASYLSELESAYASKLITNKDIFNFKAHTPLTRLALAEWIWNYDQNGIKQASLNPRGQTLLKKSKARSDAKKLLNPTLKRNRKNSGNRSRNILTEVVIESRIPRTSILQDVFQTILTKYRFPDTLTSEKKTEMVEAGIAAMVKEMGDKFSSYIAPVKSKAFKESLNGKFEGIGAHVEMIDNNFTITAPIKGSPAMMSGLLAGDIVTQVDGENILGMAIMDIIDKIKGPTGTNVVLQILRGYESKEITVTRARITVPSIDLEFKKGIPVISIYKFTKSTQSDFEKILLEEVLSKNPKGLVIDLRNDPGGFLTTAVSMGKLFTKKGTHLFSVDYRDREQKFKANKNGILSDQKNIVVLQNKGTASASEILSSIIQDYKLGTIIGTRSFGKGTVQEITNYTTGAVLKVTVAKWLTPLGKWIQTDEEKPGIIPDIEVSDPTVDEIKNKVDRQLETALRYIFNQR